MTENLKLITDLNTLCKIQKTYKEIYKKYELVFNLNESGIEISAIAFFELFNDYSISGRNSERLRYKYSTSYNGVKVFCVTNTVRPEGNHAK